MPYGGKFLIHRSVRIIPTHKKHRQQAGVLLARRSTPTCRNLSAARLSDILPGSYLLAEQSPGSSHLYTPPGVQHPQRTYLAILKEKSPFVKGIFRFFHEIFQYFLWSPPNLAPTHKPGQDKAFPGINTPRPSRYRWCIPCRTRGTCPRCRTA